MKALGGEATRQYVEVKRPDDWQSTEPTFVYDPGLNNYVERSAGLSREDVKVPLGSMGLRCAS